MALTLRHYPLASGVFNLTHLNENLSDIQDKFGSIDNSDIASDAAIAATKLAASNQEWVVQLIYHFGDAGQWPADSSGATPLVAVPMPGQNGDTSWVATDVTWVTNDVGSGDALFDVRYGSYNGSGVWANAGSIVTDVAIDDAGANDTGNQGRSARLAVSIPNGSSVTSIALMSAGQGTDAIAEASSFLAVSVRLRRVLQSI